MTGTSRNHRLDIAYNGVNYHGWQVQPRLATVQGRLEEILAALYGRPVALHGSGRTDAGVHAYGQVASFFAAPLIPATQLPRVLNDRLPLDIRIRAAAVVPDDFHARRSATSKIYRYHLWLGPCDDPFVAPFVFPVPFRPDIPAMQAGARRLCGTHDFRSFCARAEADANHIRTIHRFDVSRRGRLVFFRVEANGFLQQMVRNMVGTLLEIGRGRIPVADLDSILAARDRRRAGPTIAARGLFLLRVRYPRRPAPAVRERD
ncbi:MAG: tRNA pseudouridine(38-40) synthase TruA [Acidobacteria bacterium]|nr:tRNA pseudouridine(38-40) synthase TruA [Acidobacteriota bacterium]